MRILYLHQYFNTPSMIGSTRSFEISKKLISDGNEVTIITTLRDPNYKGKIKKSNFEGINVIWIPIAYSNKFSFIRRIFSFFNFALRSSIILFFIDYELVISTSTPLTVSIPGVIASFFKNVPMIFEIRDLWPDVPIALGIIKNKFIKYLLKKYELFLYNYSKILVVLSPDVKFRLVDQGIIKSKIATIPNFSDIEFFGRNVDYIKDDFFENLNSEKYPILMYTGTFGLVNNLSYLVDLAAFLLRIKSSIKIILVGNGLEKELLISKAILNKTFQNNLFIFDSKSKQKIPSITKTSSMMVSTILDIKELTLNSANKFFDALAARKPIFINHSGWLEDLIKKYSCGYSSFNKPLDLVAEELNILLNDKDELNKLGNNAAKLASLYFDKRKLTEQYSQLTKMSFVKDKFCPESVAPGEY